MVHLSIAGLNVSSKVSSIRSAADLRIFILISESSDELLSSSEISLRIVDLFVLQKIKLLSGISVDIFLNSHIIFNSHHIFFLTGYRIFTVLKLYFY